jgi:hypothetical protein
MFMLAEIGPNSIMRILPGMDSGKIMTATSPQLLCNRLTRVIAINLICLAFFIAFCTIMTLGSPSLLLACWNEHRALSVVGGMILILCIPGLVELALTRWGLSLS